VFHEPSAGLNGRLFPLPVREIKKSGGGLVSLRRITPLSRRDAVYFCSGVYSLFTAPALWRFFASNVA
jgi:hypothetical protein